MLIIAHLPLKLRLTFSGEGDRKQKPDSQKQLHPSSFHLLSHHRKGQEKPEAYPKYALWQPETVLPT